MSSSSAVGPVRTITCLGFDWRAEVSLKETLQLLHGKTLDRWEYSEELGADVVVYESGNALAQAMVRRNESEGGRRVLFPSTSDDEQTLTLRYPFGATRLIRCLDHASQRLGAAAVPAGERTARSLCQQLDDALRAPGVVAVALRTPTAAGLLRRADQQLCWPTPMDLDQTAALLGGAVTVQPLRAEDVAEIRRIEVGARVVAPWHGLLWAIGIGRSSAQLLERLELRHAYRLSRWPDFGVIGRRGSDVRLTALLVQRALSPEQLAQLSAIPLGVLGSYLNACALCGLLEQGANPALPPLRRDAAGDSRLGGMLRRIRTALAIAP